MQPVDQDEQQIGSQTYCEYVNGCVDIPTEPFGELFEHNDGRITRANEEHIHISADSKLHDAVQGKGHAAEKGEDPSRRSIKSISRFGRNTRESLEAVRELAGLGVIVLFEEQKIDTAETTGEMLTATEQLQAEDVPYDVDKPWNKNMVARILEDDRYIGEKYFPALIPTEQFHAAQERRKEMRPEYKQTPAQKELRKLCGGIVPDSVARRVLKILNQVVDDPQLIKIESSGVPTTEDIRQRRLELDKLLQTPPVDEEIARQKAMELAVLTLVSVEMEEYEARRLRSIFGKQAKMRELDANLLRQNVRKITYGSKTVKVLLKNNQVLEECDDA